MEKMHEGHAPAALAIEEDLPSFADLAEEAKSERKFIATGDDEERMRR